MREKLPQKLLIKWEVLFAGLALVTAAVWVLAEVFPVFKGSFFMLLFFAAGTAVFAVVLMLRYIVRILMEQREQIEQMNEALSAGKTLLEQISQGVKLSETAKTIAYREIDRHHLRTIVMEKLHQQDFKSTYAMIEDLARKIEYRTLAEALKVVADNYKDATEQERLDQIVNYIEQLLDQCQWTTASIQIESFVKKYPDSEKAKSMPHRLAEKKEHRKRQLMADWDAAVKREDTDRSLTVLQELDMYLTPSEGLALQEAASELFKNKLHNLGVQFSLAVSDKQWADALISGQEIIREFPNSKMADEIRGKLPILRELAKNSPSSTP